MSNRSGETVIWMIFFLAFVMFLQGLITLPELVCMPLPSEEIMAHGYSFGFLPEDDSEHDDVDLTQEEENEFNSLVRSFYGGGVI